MRLTLHIGTTKTGTTTIQSVMERNRALLRSQGVWYPLALGQQNHIALAAIVTEYDQTPDLHRWVGVRTRADRDAFLEQTQTAFAHELDRLRGIDHVVISNEHLHSRCHRPASFDRLEQTLRPHFDEIDVVCFLRPSVDHAISLYSTILRMGKPFSIDQFFERRASRPGDPYFDFQRMLTPWIDRFGAEHVSVELYDDALNEPGGVVGSFLRTIGFDPTAGSIRSSRPLNTSLSRAGQDLLRSRNTIDRATRRRYPKLDRRLLDWIDSMFIGPGALPSVDVARRFDDVFASSTTWVRERWFDGRRDALEPDWKRLDRGSPPPSRFWSEFPIAALYESGGLVTKARRLRDIAVDVEDDDLDAAATVMALAARLHPAGRVIAAKCKEYEERRTAGPPR